MWSGDRRLSPPQYAAVAPRKCLKYGVRIRRFGAFQSRAYLMPECITGNGRATPPTFLSVSISDPREALEESGLGPPILPCCRHWLHGSSEVAGRYE